jgi:hypothetical protein
MSHHVHLPACFYRKTSESTCIRPLEGTFYKNIGRRPTHLLDLQWRGLERVDEHLHTRRQVGVVVHLNQDIISDSASKYAPPHPFDHSSSQAPCHRDAEYG